MRSVNKNQIRAKQENNDTCNQYTTYKMPCGLFLNIVSNLKLDGGNETGHAVHCSDIYFLE